MANPQIEDGYTKIANELLLALTKSNINGTDFMICLAVISKTYGWNKIKDQISLSQFQLLTGLSKQRCIHSIRRLVLLSILGSITGNTRTTSTYWIIKDYDKWIRPSISGNPSITADKKLVLPLIQTKYNNKRQLNTPAFDFDPLWENYPKKLGKHDALRHFKAQVRNDKDYNDIKTALHNFLNSNVLKGDIKFIPHGSTWFNNRWRDWIEYQEITKKEEFMELL